MPDLALSSAISVALVLRADTVSVRRNSLYNLDAFHSLKRYPMNVWNLMGRFMPLHGVSRF